jgi:hypothetical protein
MIRLFLIAAAAFVLPVCASAQCPVTTASKPPFVPPAPYRTMPEGGFWYGTESLWTWIPNDPQWWLGGEKIVYWRAGFDARKEHQPDLKVVARRLDAQAPLVWGMRTSGVWFREGSPGDMAMMSGIDISPTTLAGKGGCWEIAAHYENAERSESRDLSFVVQVP